MSAAQPERVILAGDLLEFDIAELIAAFGLGRQVMSVEVLGQDGRCEGRVVIKSGRIVSATAGELSGAAAVETLLAIAQPAQFRVLCGPAEAVVEHVEEVETSSGQVRPPDRSGTRSRVLEGNTADFSLADLLKAVAVTRQHTLVELFDERDARAGILRLKAGQLLSAQAGSAFGVPAVHALLRTSANLRFTVWCDEDEPLAQLRAVGSLSEVLGSSLQPSAADDSRTMRRPTPSYSAPRRSARIMEGTLADLELATLLQALSAGRQYFEVQISDEQCELVGSIELKASVLVGARIGALHGLAAFERLLRLPSRFNFAVFRSQPPETMNALARLDELLPVHRVVRDPGDDTPTVARGTPEPKPNPKAAIPVLDGSFAEFDLASLLHVVGTSRQYTSVSVLDDQRRLAGELHVKAGQVVSAQAGDAPGIAAVRRMLHSPRDFSFVVQRHPDAGDVHVSLGPIREVLQRAGSAAALPERTNTGTIARSSEELRTSSSGLLALAGPSEQRSSGPRNVLAVADAATAPLARDPMHWLGAAAFGAGFVLLGGAAAALILRQPAPIPVETSPPMAATNPSVSPSAASVASSAPSAPQVDTAPAPPSPDAANRVPAGAAVFGPAASGALPLGRAAIASMQAALKQLGYDPGPIDGIFGARTSGAVRLFQYAEQLAPDGELSAPTRTRLAARVGGL